MKLHSTCFSWLSPDIALGKSSLITFLSIDLDQICFQSELNKVPLMCMADDTLKFCIHPSSTDFMSSA